MNKHRLLRLGLMALLLAASALMGACLADETPGPDQGLSPLPTELPPTAEPTGLPTDLPAPAAAEPATTHQWWIHNQPDYGFTFRYPATWRLERDPAAPQVLRLRHTQQPGLVLTAGFRLPGEEVPIEQAGFPEGDRITQGAIRFFGEAVWRQAVASDGQVWAVLYNDGAEFEAGGLVFALVLEVEGAGDAAVPAVTGIGPGIEAEVDRIVQTFARLPVLTVDETPVVSRDVDAPTHFEYLDRLDEDTQTRLNAMRIYAEEQHRIRTNAALAPFGYRIEPVYNSTWQGWFWDLYREGEDEPFLPGLTFFWPVSVNASGTDFVMALDNAPNVRPPYLLLTAEGTQEWDAPSANWLPPVYAGEQLAVLTMTQEMTSTYQVLLDGQAVYSGTAAMMGEYHPLRSFTGWNGHWVLQVEERLIVDGMDLGEREGYDAAFGFSVLEGQPFYFFRQGDAIRLSYAGRTLPNSYTEVVHDACCEPAMFNVMAYEVAVWFHALVGDVWHVVEVGVYDGEVASTYRYTDPTGWSFRYPAHWDTLELELQFVQDSQTAKTLQFDSAPAAQDEVEAWIEGEIARKLAATEADNRLAERLTARQEGALLVYRYAILSRQEGSETLLRTTVFFDGARRYLFSAALPPLTEEEYGAILASFQPVGW